MTTAVLDTSWESDFGLLQRSCYRQRLCEAGLPIHVKNGQEEGARLHRFGKRLRAVAQPITLTPFAAVKPCSARCLFCSETLVHRSSRRLAAGLRPGPGYHRLLATALAELRGLPFSLSLSGLEATDDAAWLCGVLDAVDDYQAAGGIVGTKVLYTNGNGLTRQRDGRLLLARLGRFGLTRAEWSRHHPEAEANDRIMRFKAGEPVRAQKVCEETIADALAALPLRLVCVLQHGGVADLEGLGRYLHWARRLGVTDVVFREMSRLGNLYRPNRSYRYIESRRVALETLLQQLWPSEECHPNFEPVAVTAGYYYWNLRLRWRGSIDVTLETSDYREMKRRHRSEVVYKLVFHANGNLCGDWDPDKEVLLSAGELG